MRKMGVSLLAVLAGLLLTNMAYAQKMTVKILNRQDNESGYSYQVPAHYSSTSNATANCYGSDNVNCSAHETTNGYATAGHEISYSVRGATLSLLLPDGRLAVVNCMSKYKLKMDYINRRSCRAPMVDVVEVEFKGKEAKLEWVASIDGKKKDSETYRILAVLPPQQ